MRQREKKTQKYQNERQKSVGQGRVQSVGSTDKSAGDVAMAVVGR
jgi:hypothetical protein